MEADRAVTVTVIYTAQLAMVTARASETVQVATGSSVLAVVKDLALRYPPAFAGLLLHEFSGCLRESVLVMVNGAQITGAQLSQPLPDGAELLLLTPMAGG